MSSTGFLSTSNVEMLWNIIIDNVISGNESNVTELQTIFHTHLIPFFGSEGKNTNDLIVLNKKYISWFINHLNRKNQEANISKNNKDTLITVEDIHKNRQSQFEQELNERQQELTSYMTLKPPEVPKFSIDLNDEVPIKEFENTIKQMTAQRNYDVDMINKNNNNPSDVKTWLKPSINNIKQIKIDTVNLDSAQHNNIVDLNKHITWKDQMPEENNIFSKLKKINVSDINNNNNEIITNLQNSIHDMQNKMNDMNNNIDKIFKLLNKNE
jgi:hypothetical protein